MNNRNESRTNLRSSSRLLHKFKSSWKSDSTALLFAYEGVLIALINNLINNNNNLFATRLGATDFQLTLVIALPQLVGILVLLPGG
ncbi:MAG: hypothetical protein Q8930_10050, partial [Bacillota bacterium]|nr:hypothetical protein [Bacillota bacterium]